MADPTTGTGAGLVLGGDVGGTSTRIAIADLSGRVVSRGLGPGGNPVAHPETARDSLAAALAAALDGVDAGSVRASVVGMAGSGAVRDPGVRAGYQEVWRAAGLSGFPNVRPDLEVAFAAGTDQPDGSVMIAGTGAVAGRVSGRRLVAAMGGHGWLLGDEGAGFWIGREAVRVALQVLEDARQPGALSALVLEALDVPPSAAAARNALVRAAYARPPVTLSALAPLVTRAQQAGDPVATSILDDAAQHLLAMWERLDTGGNGGPVVLSGSVIQPGTYLGEAVRAGLGTRAVPPCWVADPVLGAVRLALREVERS